MLNLILSILCSTLIVVVLRLFPKYKINTAHAIVFNYAVCVLVGFIAIENKANLALIPSWNGWWICLLLGTAFTLIFTLVGRSTALLGIASTSIAFKLSFIIPTVVSIIYYGDTITIFKIIGIIAAIVAIYFITYQKEKTSKNINDKNDFISKNAWLLPIIIFVGGGISDTIFNMIQRNYTPDGFDHIVSVTIFFGALLSGIIAFGLKKEMYTWKNLIAGIVLGIPNYGSLYFLLQALKYTGYTPSTLFPINNISIICVTSIIGLIIFKESFSTRKIIGFALAIISIVLIGFL